jgi:nitroimidazol reductase NimA-like FMN-containing flavoprotein (pyridoxamine 5'-phosphate oxidase superfamily)
MRKTRSTGEKRGVILTTTRKGSVQVPARLRLLDRSQRHAVLATAAGTGPHASLIAFVLTKDGKGIVFATPKATAKYRNMKRNSRVSVLIDSRESNGKDTLTAEAVTVYGRAREIHEGPQWAELAMLFVSKHRSLEPFVAAPSTAVMLVTISRCVHVGRFQAVTAWKPA